MLHVSPCANNGERKCAENYNKQHNKFIFQTAISILLISNHNSFRVLFDKIASVYFIWKKNIYILALEMASPENQHCANCICTLSFPMAVSSSGGVAHAIYYVLPVSWITSCFHTMARNRRRDKSEYSEWLNSGQQWTGSGVWYLWLFCCTGTAIGLCVSVYLSVCPDTNFWIKWCCTHYLASWFTLTLFR